MTNDTRPSRTDTEGRKGGGPVPDSHENSSRRPQTSPGHAVSSTFLALIAAFLLLAVLMVMQPDYARWLVFPFVLTGFVIALCLHEFGHALVAYHCGDVSVQEKGYLTLDPLNYANVQYSIVFPLLIMAIGGIGLPGGAVYIRRELLHRPGYGMLVSAGGPVATAVVLFLFMLALRLGADVLAAAPSLRASLAFLALLEVTTLVFNLLPCPGLDGWGIIEPWIPEPVRDFGRRLAPIGPAILVFLLFLPVLYDLFWHSVIWASTLVGLDVSLAFRGFRLFQFWR